MYVYLYSDPQTLEPFYVGKGQGRRARAHLSRCKREQSYFYMKLRKMLSEGIIPLIEKIEVSSEWFANELEKGLIRLIGRKDLGLGTLTNLTDGGEGSNKSKETRERISHSRKGQPSGNKGKKQVAWNKGLTKETHPSVARYSTKISEYARTRTGERNSNWKGGVTYER